VPNAETLALPDGATLASPDPETLASPDTLASPGPETLASPTSASRPTSRSRPASPDRPTARVVIPDCPPAAVALLRRELGVSGVLAQVLVRRGYGDPATAHDFLAARELHPPSRFAGIDRAVTAIARRVQSGELITVHGDYDVDGVCSTAVLVRALRALGASVDSYLPDRASDGYGLNSRTVRMLAARGTRLLLTADCAVGAVEEVAEARALGMEVVVSDHHSPRADGELPLAPLVHPALCGYPCPSLCATAVAHKLAQALVDGVEAGAAGPLAPERAQDARRTIAQDLDLVALATIADQVPLTGENRTLARRGLRALAATPKPGLRALMAVAGVQPAKLGERAAAFALAPRLNAAGRLYRADAGLELLLTDDAARARQIAAELDRANCERREIEQRICHEAEAQMAQLGSRAAYVLAGERWHAGVIGIVASRLVERSHRPVVLVALDGETGKGSARSIDCFDLLGGLRACESHLLRYGGHRAAAGLEIERRCLPQFQAALAAHATRALAGEQLGPVERVDAVLGADEVGMELAEELQLLAPFGRGNAPVSLLIPDARFADEIPMGEGKHVRFNVHSRGVRARAVAFRTPRLPVAAGEAAEATFALEVNEWNGISEPRLVLRSARAASQPQAAVSPTPAARDERLAAAERRSRARERRRAAAAERRRGGAEAAPARPPVRRASAAEQPELTLF
jgi:single-stranded-DNA-specific exonuclease